MLNRDRAKGWQMTVYGTRAVVAAIILGCCVSAQAKKHNQKVDPLTRKSFNAPVESVYAAAVKVAGRQWQVISTDQAAHGLSFQTTNTPLETAGAYSTYSVSVTCTAMAGDRTAVSLEVTEHRPDQPSLAALMNRSERRKGMLQDFWDGVEAALKENPPPQTPVPAVQQPSAPAIQQPSAPAAPQTAPPASSESAPAPPRSARAAASELPPVTTSRIPKPSAGELAVVTIKSSPEGADIAVDGKFFGDTPTTARLPGGDYTISIEKAGYKPWKRTVTLTEGGTVTLDATLESDQ
jgi:PEGA domain-containing protein